VINDLTTGMICPCAAYGISVTGRSSGVFSQSSGR